MVGIIDQEPYGGFRGDSKILIPLDLAQKLNVAQGSDMRNLLRDRPGNHTYTTLTARVSKPAPRTSSPTRMATPSTPASNPRPRCSTP